MEAVTLNQLPRTVVIPMKPKVFVSYSWTSHAHQSEIIEWAERLIADGVKVLLDVYDLKEGQDKYAFMERMVTDPSVTHVLVFCDKLYAEKANERKAGVGTESQIISKEVYDKVDQSKFVPIITEVDDDGNPFLPVTFKSRIWIDFSTPERVNANWEKLIRHLFGKPLHEKPQLGKPPSYITKDTSAPASPARGKYESLKQAIIQNKRGVAAYRRDFIESCVSFADSMRVRETPDIDNLPQKILEDSTKLLPIRDHIVDWVLLESELAPGSNFSEDLFGVLERLLSLKGRPREISAYNESWFDAHNLFVYQTFLYIVAALLKTGGFDDLHNIFTSHFFLPEAERIGNQAFARFDVFCASSEVLNAALVPEGQKLYSPAAELVRRQASREDVTFAELMEADLLALLMAMISFDTYWFPQLMYYARYSMIPPFFLRATQHKHFKKLAMITGIASADELREAVKDGHDRLRVNEWCYYSLNHSFWEVMNMDRLDTIK